LIALALLDSAAAWIALLLFNHASIYVPLVAPMMELNLTVLLGLISDLSWERIEKIAFAGRWKNMFPRMLFVNYSTSQRRTRSR